MDEVRHRPQGCQNDYRPKGYQMRDDSVGFSDNEPAAA
jgi:hypothetical protein